MKIVQALQAACYALTRRAAQVVTYFIRHKRLFLLRSTGKSRIAKDYGNSSWACLNSKALITSESSCFENFFVFFAQQFAFFLVYKISFLLMSFLFAESKIIFSL